MVSEANGWKTSAKAFDLASLLRGVSATDPKTDFSRLIEDLRREIIFTNFACNIYKFVALPPSQGLHARSYDHIDDMLFI